MLHKSSIPLWILFIVACTVQPALFTAGSPDPCTLVTTAELEQILGRLQDGPKAADNPGEISCSYGVATDSSTLDIMLHQGDFAALKKSFAGKTTPVREFGKEAFMASQDFSAEVFVRKGNFVLRVALSKSPNAMEKVKEITRKALARL